LPTVENRAGIWQGAHSKSWGFSSWCGRRAEREEWEGSEARPLGTDADLRLLHQQMCLFCFLSRAGFFPGWTVLCLSNQNVGAAGDLRSAGGSRLSII
jgi:hypothetical protein